jgi:hypothetical protein
MSARLVLALVLVHDVMASRPAQAQGLFELRPLMATAQVFDSNLFYTSMDPQADFITRISPGVVSDYRSPRLALLGRYTLDFERFAEHPELSGMAARQQATVTMAYHATPRVTVAADADYSTTHTPSELNVDSGLILSRAKADRVAAHASVTRAIDPATTATIDYQFTQYGIQGASGILTHVATIGGARKVSRRDTVTVDYRLHQYVVGTAAPTSHEVRVGWTRAITERSMVAIDGGPRVTNGRPGTELSASVRYRFQPGDLALAYVRTQTTAIGFTGVADLQKISATAAWNPRRTLRMQISPAVFRSTQSELQANVYRLSVDVARQMTNVLSINAVVDADLQHSTWSSAGDVDGQPVDVGLQFALRAAKHGR